MLTATVLGSGVAMLDSTVVNIALPAIGRDLGAGLAGLSWVVNGYTLALASLILLGGSLGDRFGRRRLFVIGLVWFGVASLSCGLAPTTGTLIAGRMLQGIGGALLTPGSLAILQTTFRTEDRSRAIGAWSGLGGIAGAIGPFVGGWIVEVSSWRWVFLVNVPLIAATVLVAVRYVPESRDSSVTGRVDVVGAALGIAGLGALTYGLTAWSERGLTSPVVLVPLLLGLAGMVAFVWFERVTASPMLDLSIFSSRLFTATNAVTLAVYAALSGVFFWLVLSLQVVAGYSPLVAGLSLLPVTVLMLVLSARAGAWAQRVGPRIPMTLGPLVSAVGVGGLTRAGTGQSYLLDVLVPVTVFGLGLAMTVAPLTSTVLAAVPDEHAGVASGVNNAVARVAGLLAIAALPLVAGVGGAGFGDPAALGPAYRTVMLVCAGLLAAGGIIAWVFVRSPALSEPPSAPEPCDHFCAVGGPPLT